jgi:UPF0716 family protein affecting phage T7 exclusion
MPMAKKPLILPGWGSQTPAVQALIPSNRRKVRRKTTRRKTTRRKKAPARRRTARKSYSRKKKPARLVKGSAAAKRHMAKLRRMRGKKKR